MLAENIFVTTVPAPDAFADANEFAKLAGFVPESSDAATTVQWTRGPNKAGYRSFEKLPMRLRMDFDRQRVTLALTIDEAQVLKTVTDYGLTLLNSMEALLKGYDELEQAFRPVAEAELAVRAKHRAQRMSIITVAGIVVAVIIAIVVVAIMLGP